MKGKRIARAGVRLAAIKIRKHCICRKNRKMSPQVKFLAFVFRREPEDLHVRTA